VDNYDRELYYHPRLPKVVNDGPTAAHMRSLEELAARVVDLRCDETVGVREDASEMTSERAEAV